MTYGAKKSKLEPVDGAIRCPRCGGLLQRVLPESSAVNWPIYCRKCGVEYVVNIRVSQSPERPEPRLSESFET